MKRIVIPMLLASVLCASLASCGGKDNENDNNNNNNNGGNQSVTITESTNPKTLVGEKVDRTAWQAAFTEQTNYTVKTVVDAELTQNGDTMSESVTIVYKMAADKSFVTIGVKEGKKAVFEAEAYMEYQDDTVTLWQRAKVSGAWSDWEGESYPQEDIEEMLSFGSDVSFLKDNYANFAYNDADKGYLATTSGLAEMQEELDTFAQGILNMISGDSLNINLGKFIVKLNNGKLSACLAELTLGANDQTPARRENEPDDIARDDGTDSPEQGEGTGDEDNTEGGENGDDTTPEAPMSGNITLTQLFYDYGTTAITRPENLPAVDDEEEDESPEVTPDDTPDPTKFFIR